MYLFNAADSEKKAVVKAEDGKKKIHTKVASVCGGDVPHEVHRRRRRRGQGLRSCGEGRLVPEEHGPRRAPGDLRNQACHPVSGPQEILEQAGSRTLTSKARVVCCLPRESARAVRSGRCCVM